LLTKYKPEYFLIVLKRTAGGLIGFWILIQAQLDEQIKLLVIGDGPEKN
jgi:hypothetical protein